MGPQPWSSPPRIASAFTLLLGILQVCNAQTQHANAVVSGHVYYENGNPVEGAVVDFRCLCALAGMLPAPTHTDKQGSFTLSHAAWGKGWLTASKELEGFPDATIALHGRSNPSYVLVDLKEGAVLSGLDLHFPAPRPLLTLKVLDRASSSPVPDATIRIAWSDHPDMVITTSSGANGICTLLLPNRPVSITVYAPDRNLWRYRDPKTGALFLETSDSPVDINAQLEAP